MILDLASKLVQRALQRKPWTALDAGNKVADAVGLNAPHAGQEAAYAIGALHQAERPEGWNDTECLALGQVLDLLTDGVTPNEKNVMLVRARLTAGAS